MENNSNSEIKETSFSNPVEDFNLGLMIYVVNASIVWVILVVVTCIILSLVYLRYTPRIFESSTTLMLKTEKSTQLLGSTVQRLVVEHDPSEVSREMQLITSKLLLDRVIDQLPLEVGYYKEGKTKFIFTELYTSSPFRVQGRIKDESIYATPIYLKILSGKKYYVSFTMNGKDYEYSADTGKVLSSPFFTIQTSFYRPISPENVNGLYYFKFLARADVEADIANKLAVMPIDPATQTVALIFKDRNPERAKDIVQKISDEFILYDLERKRESFVSILRFLDAQIDTFGYAFDKFQDSISALKITEGYMDKGGNYLSLLADQSLSFEEAFRDIDNDLQLLVLFKRAVQKENDYSTLPTFTFREKTIFFGAEVAEINKTQKDRNLMMLEVTQGHPNVRLKDKEIEEGKIRLSKNVDNAINGLHTKQKLLKEEHDKYMAELFTIPDLQHKFDRLDKMAAIKNDFVLNLYSEKSNYLIASAGIVSDYVILQRAFVSKVPISPRETFVKLAGVLTGLILGLVIIVIRYLLQNTIISIDDVEKKTRAPLLGVIPRYKDELVRSQIVVTQDPKSTITEAFRAVRSGLQFIGGTPGTKIIATTSTIPGEGKTFISLNVAAILSLLNKKVIILDFDMRKPRLDKIFSVDAYRGVSTILSSQSGIDECIMETGIPNLDFIVSGPVPPNPSELILLPKLHELLDYLKTRYDYIVIDTPPIGLVTDALEILKIADYPMYVFRAAYSNRGFVQNVNKIMTESKIKNLSVVINDYGRGASGYGYSYGYNYGYSYGYGYGYGYGYYGKKYGEGYYTTDTKPKQKSFWKKLFSKSE